MRLFGHFSSSCHDGAGCEIKLYGLSGGLLRY